MKFLGNLTNNSNYICLCFICKAANKKYKIVSAMMTNLEKNFLIMLLIIFRKVEISAKNNKSQLALREID